MCAIVSGTMDVVEPEDEDKPIEEYGMYKQINKAVTGDVLGEMGLLRGAPRSATVIASQDCEYLEINLKMIRRLQWLYPPTAQKFFVNMMGILCDRVERLTTCLANESMVDDLTGLNNRKGFIRSLKQEANRAHRLQETLVMATIGVEFNDAAGRVARHSK